MQRIYIIRLRPRINRCTAEKAAEENPKRQIHRYRRIDEKLRRSEESIDFDHHTLINTHRQTFLTRNRNKCQKTWVRLTPRDKKTNHCDKAHGALH